MTQDRLWRTALVTAMGCLLFLIYLLTFNGIERSVDSAILIDATNSLAIFGNLLQNQTANNFLIQTSTVELAQPALSVPLYWAAYHIPWIGNSQSLFLFSPLMTVLTAVVLFYFSRDFGYSDRTALIVSLLFGLTTIAFPYAKTYFREPLTTLNMFAAAFFLNRWREAFKSAMPRQWLYAGLGMALAFLAFFSKEAILISLPVLVALAYPGGKSAKANWRYLVIIGGAILLLAVLTAVGIYFLRVEFATLYNRYDVLRRLNTLLQGFSGVGPGILGFLISPGKAIWWYSPVALLALVAPALVPRERWRETWLPLILTILFVVVYAAIRGVVWFGGSGWGARYTIPLIPFLMLGTLPAVDYAIRSNSKWPKLLLGLLTLWGLLVQVGGVTVDFNQLDGFISEGTGMPSWLGPGMWSFYWSQAFAAWRFMFVSVPDILWFIQPVNWGVIITVVLGIIATAAAVLFVLRSTRPSPGILYGMFFALPVLTGVTAVFALASGYDDPRYLGYRQDLDDLVETVQNRIEPDSAVLVSVSYINYFTNYYKGEAPWYSLPEFPGERYTQNDVPDVVSDDVNEMLGPKGEHIIGLFQHGADFYTGQPMWYVDELSHYLSWAVLPAEQYLLYRHFIAEIIDFSPEARAIMYLPMNAPGIDIPPDAETNALFGGGMRLAGVTVVDSAQRPVSNTVLPGEMMGISLLWEAASLMDRDYTVSIHLIAPDGRSLMQIDRQPINGFNPTTSWQIGDLYRDNYGFVLPDDLPPGQYQFWLSVYSNPPFEIQPPVGPQQETLGDYLTLISFEVVEN